MNWLIHTNHQLKVVWFKMIEIDDHKTCCSVNCLCHTQKHTLFIQVPNAYQNGPYDSGRLPFGPRYLPLQKQRLAVGTLGASTVVPVLPQYHWLGYKDGDFDCIVMSQLNGYVHYQSGDALESNFLVWVDEGARQRLLPCRVQSHELVKKNKCQSNLVKCIQKRFRFSSFLAILQNWIW